MYFYIEIRKNDLINPFSSLLRPRFGVGAYSMLTAVDAYDLLQRKPIHSLSNSQLYLGDLLCSVLFQSRKNKSTFLFADVSLQMYFICKKKS